MFNVWAISQNTRVSIKYFYLVGYSLGKYLLNTRYFSMLALKQWTSTILPGSSSSCPWANPLASLTLFIRQMKGIFNFLFNSNFLLFLILKWHTFNSDRNPILKYEDYESTVWLPILPVLFSWILITKFVFFF